MIVHYHRLMKKITLILLITLSASICAVAQTAAYKVYAVRFAGTAHPFPISDWADKGPTTDSVRINFMVWLIKGSNGKNILVDAGFINDTPRCS